MSWRSVDTEQDLINLSEIVCWEDSETLEFYATSANEVYFPSDIARSGHENMNLHVLSCVDSEIADYLEVVFIDCDETTMHFLTNLYIGGRVDSLKRVFIEYPNKNQCELKCSRLIYRFLDESPLVKSGRYFQEQK